MRYSCSFLQQLNQNSTAGFELQKRILNFNISALTQCKEKRFSALTLHFLSEELPWQRVHAEIVSDSTPTMSQRSRKLPPDQVNADRECSISIQYLSHKINVIPRWHSVNSLHAECICALTQLAEYPSETLWKFLGSMRISENTSWHWVHAEMSYALTHYTKAKIGPKTCLNLKYVIYVDLLRVYFLISNCV